MISALYCLPGADQAIEDVSGEYVYYRDESFKTPSVVGFAYYNDSLYAARYYTAGDGGAGEKDIAIYVSAEADASRGLTLTGGSE